MEEDERNIEILVNPTEEVKKAKMREYFLKFLEDRIFAFVDDEENVHNNKYKSFITTNSIAEHVSLDFDGPLTQCYKDVRLVMRKLNWLPCKSSNDDNLVRAGYKPSLALQYVRGLRTKKDVENLISNEMTDEDSVGYITFKDILVNLVGCSTHYHHLRRIIDEVVFELNLTKFYVERFDGDNVHKYEAFSWKTDLNEVK